MHRESIHSNWSLCFLMSILFFLSLFLPDSSTAYAQEAKYIILLIADGLGRWLIEATNAYAGTLTGYESDPVGISTFL